MNEGTKIGIGIVAAITLILWFAFSGCVPNYSDGQRVGYVRKLSQKGWANKTWEGTLLLRAVEGEQYSAEADLWNFTAENSEVAKQLTKAMRESLRVMLTYRQWLKTPPLESDTGYIVTAVREL